MQDNIQTPTMKRVLTLFIDEFGENNIIHFEYNKNSDIDTIADLVEQLILATKLYEA